jgi:PII-like signaling protein
MTQPRIAVQVPIYLKEADEWHRKPLHLDAADKLPVLTFVDMAGHIDRVLTRVKEMAGHRLIVRENAVIKAGEFE